jgi:hypothetical protein
VFALLANEWNLRCGSSIDPWPRCDEPWKQGKGGARRTADRVLLLMVAIAERLKDEEEEFEDGC